MAAQLINGNGFEGCTAQVDADFYEGIFGTETGILTVGQKMRAEMVNNQPRVYDGVILTKEGRRIQIDYGAYQDFTIPAGTTATLPIVFTSDGGNAKTVTTFNGEAVTVADIPGTGVYVL